MKRAYSILGAIAITAIATGVGLPRIANAAEVADAHRIAVSGDVLDSLVGQPESDFHQAFALFSRGNLDSAASELRAGAGLLRLEAGRANPENRDRLLSAAAELDGLAARVAHGDVASRTELNPVFVGADLALAAQYRTMAAQAVADKHHAAAGRWLHAAADSVDDATQWTGQPPPTAQAQAWDQVHALNVKIHSGANWTYDEARSGIGYLGTQIQYLGTRMQQFGNPTATANPAP